MKWFFLAFIALLAVTGNAAIFESFSLGRAIGGIAFNLFILSLLVIWWASYFSGTQAKARLLVIGHATIMLAAGIGITLIGTNVALANSCESLIFSDKPNGFLSQFATYLQSRGYCRELGFGVVLFGFFMAYPSIRLFVSITRRSSGPPSAAAEL
jgi:hypothetical protein